MKKLIFILLIAIIVCEIIEDEQPLKESALEILLNLIKEAGVAQKLKDMLLDKGKAEAKSECCRLFPLYCGQCHAAIAALY